jgi:hypothetical protein
LIICGYFLSEGSTFILKNRPNSKTLVFTFDRKRTEYINETFNYFKELGARPVLSDTKTAIQVTISSNVLATLFINLFNTGSSKKTIPTDWLYLPEEKLYALLCGYLRGDGSADSSSNKRLSYSSVSINLSERISFILMRLSYLPITRKKDKEKIKSKINGREIIARHDSYSSFVYTDAYKLNEKIKKSFYVRKPSKSHINWQQDENYICVPIISIEHEDYIGSVYNIEVEETHNYVANRILIANCNTPLFWQFRYRWRSGKNVLEEVKELYYKHGVKVFTFNDDAFPVSKTQCLDFCKGVVEEGMQIAWKSDTRADVIDDEMAYWMKKSGCFMVAIGIESGSEKIRQTISKNLDINKAKETIKVLKKHGILAYVLLMVGNIGETTETILETKQFLIETQPDIATWVNGVLLCPQTEIFKIAKQQGLVDESYFLHKTNGLPIYYGEHSQTDLSRLSGLLDGWKH